MSGRIQNGVRAVWQSLALALPIGLAGGVVGTAFHIAVEQVTELRAAQGWLLWLLPLPGLGSQRCIRCCGARALQPTTYCARCSRQAPAAGLDTRHLSGRCADPPVRAALPDGRALPCKWAAASAGPLAAGKSSRPPGGGAPPCARHGGAVLGAVRHTDGLGTLCSDRGAGGGQLCPGAGAQPGGCTDRQRRILCRRHRPHCVPGGHAGPDLADGSAGRAAGGGLRRRDRGFCWVLHETKHLLAHWLPNLYFRAAAGGRLLAALSWLLGGRYCGAGMNVIAQAVEQGQALPWDFVCKALLTALTLGAGFKGGEVVPSFFVGACFGCIAGPLLGLPAGAAAAVGLVSVFCGATNTPAASILLAVELFGGQGTALCAIGCVLCFWLSGSHGLYEAQQFARPKLGE